MLRMVQRCVPVHDKTPKIKVAVDKTFPDPDQVILSLLFQSDTGTQPRMDKKQVIGLVPKWQGINEIKMGSGHSTGCDCPQCILPDPPRHPVEMCQPLGLALGVRGEMHLALYPI